MTSCSAPASSTTTAPAPSVSTTSTVAAISESTVPPPTTAAVEIDAGDLSGFEISEVTLAGRPLVVAVADDPSLRARGLMGVTDLGDVDGMLFSWGGNVVSARFVMRNTLIPLTIAFFGVDGRLIGTVEMVPCEREPCPTYGASRAYAYAIEFPDGIELGMDAVLEFSSGD